MNLAHCCDHDIGACIVAIAFSDWCAWSMLYITDVATKLLTAELNNMQSLKYSTTLSLSLPNYIQRLLCVCVCVYVRAFGTYLRR